MRARVVLGMIFGVAAVAATVSADHHANVALAQMDMRPSSMAFQKSMDSMMSHMHMAMTGDADRDFATMMVPHHQAAIDMAKAELEYGKDPEMKELARKIIDAQGAEIRLINDWLVRAQADDHH